MLVILNVCDYWHCQSLVESKCITLILAHIIISTVTYWEESRRPTYDITYVQYSLFCSVICFRLHMCHPDQLTTVTLLYENQQHIKGIILFMSNKVYVPHLCTAGVEVPMVCFSPWYLVLSTLFVLTSLLYQIISLHKLNQLSYYFPHIKRELCKHHLCDPESARLLSSESSELTYKFSATNYR